MGTANAETSAPRMDIAIVICMARYTADESPM